MPFVSVRILKCHSQKRNDEISRRVTDAITEIAEIPKEAVWVVFEEVKAEHCYVGATRVSELKKGAEANQQWTSNPSL